MSQAQYQAEVMDELMQQEYNSNFGTGESSDDLHSRGNRNTDGQIRSLGEVFMLTRQIKSN
jgi:hypothetical protein